MRHPSYMLNPGDMFQVDTEKVLYALGEKKKRKNSVGEVDPLVKEALEKQRIAKMQNTVAQAEASPGAREEKRNDDELDQARKEFENMEDEDEGAETAPADGVVKTRNAIKSLQERTKSIIDDPKTKDKLTVKQKQSVRALAKSLQSARSKPSSTTPSDLDDWEAQLQSISSNLRSNSAKRRDDQDAANAKKANDVSKAELKLTSRMKEALEKYKKNPVNAAKPYLTPWRPRPYMSAFAFIPRYLEVNQNICSAVYLRHPVCYPGFAEVPTPFSQETGQLAYTWYLRRR